MKSKRNGVHVTAGRKTSLSGNGTRNVITTSGLISKPTAAKSQRGLQVDLVAQEWNARARYTNSVTLLKVYVTNPRNRNHKPVLRWRSGHPTFLNSSKFFSTRNSKKRWNLVDYHLHHTFCLNSPKKHTVFLSFSSPASWKRYIHSLAFVQPEIRGLKHAKRLWSLGLLSTSLILDIHVMLNWHLSKEGIRWPVSRDYIAGSSL